MKGDFIIAGLLAGIVFLIISIVKKEKNKSKKRKQW